MFRKAVANVKTIELPGKEAVFTKILFFITLLLSLTPLISPPIALLMGLIIAQTTGHPYAHLNHKATHILLQVSVVGLGFGMNAMSAIQAGKSGFWFTVASIFGILTLGYFLGKMLRINRKTSHLISSGTAICGGSAIAAVSPVIKAEENQISIALGTVFILNSVALFIFPAIGHHFHLSQTQFGMWCAIAIHDTSSVVGAAAKYGDQALGVATTVKLARALWIIPVAFLSAVAFRNKGTKIKIPYFIGLFILAIIIHTYVPFVSLFSDYIVLLAKAGLTATLFLIGCGLSRSMWKAVGIKPMIQGTIQWVLIAVITLIAIMHFAS